MKHYGKFIVLFLLCATAQKQLFSMTAIQQNKKIQEAGKTKYYWKQLVEIYSQHTPTEKDTIVPDNMRKNCVCTKELLDTNALVFYCLHSSTITKKFFIQGMDQNTGINYGFTLVNNDGTIKMVSKEMNTLPEANFELFPEKKDLSANCRCNDTKDPVVCRCYRKTTLRITDEGAQALKNGTKKLVNIGNNGNIGMVNK